jgi:ribosome production factor 2
MTATTRKGKKALEAREPHIEEGRKTSLFIKGRKSSDFLNQVCEELAKFRWGEIKKYSRKNDALPFESTDEIEKYCSTTNCSLFLFFSHQKKRPNNLVFGRLFNKRVLEMYEVGVVDLIPDLPRGSYEPASVPALLFEGPEWEIDYAPFRSVLIDFFVGELKGELTLDQVQHLIVFTINTANSRILFRHYGVNQETEEPSLSLIAPAFDLIPRRSQLPDPDVFETALVKPAVARKKKNIVTDELGRQLGRVFVRKQEVSKLKLRRFDGLDKAKKEMPVEPVDDAQ